MSDYTSKTIQPLTQLVSDLNNLSDSSFTAFVGQSREFAQYLDVVSKMKDTIHSIDLPTVIRPVQALAVQSVELFNTLGVTLASVSLAPEDEDNQLKVADILDQYQAANQSLFRLRALLEEKEALLTQEADKLRSAEARLMSIEDG
jgi:hypothetical protein